MGAAQSYRGSSSPVNLYSGQSSSPDSRDPHYSGKERGRSTYTHCHPNHGGELDYSVTSNRDSPRLGSQSSDSPDPVKQRHDNNQSPSEHSRSYSSQHNNDRDENQLRTGYHSPNNDSIGSRSPVNLNNNSAKFSSHLNEMLDHKLQLSFLGPPLAALHSMTEMKGQSSPNAPQGTQVASNPHGIDTILSRPPPVTSAGLNALASGELKILFIIS